MTFGTPSEMPFKGDCKNCGCSIVQVNYMYPYKHTEWAHVNTRFTTCLGSDGKMLLANRGKTTEKVMIAEPDEALLAEIAAM